MAIEATMVIVVEMVIAVAKVVAVAEVTKEEGATEVVEAIHFKANVGVASKKATRKAIRNALSRHPATLLIRLMP